MKIELINTSYRTDIADEMPLQPLTVWKERNEGNSECADYIVEGTYFVNEDSTINLFNVYNVYKVWGIDYNNKEESIKLLAQLMHGVMCMCVFLSVQSIENYKPSVFDMNEITSALEKGESWNESKKFSFGN